MFAIATASAPASIAPRRATSKLASRHGSSFVCSLPIRAVQPRVALSGRRPGRGASLVVQANLFNRLGRVIGSYANSLVSAAEDPEKILDQTVIEMQEDLVKMRQASAQVPWTFPNPKTVCRLSARNCVIHMALQDLRHLAFQD